MSEPEFAPLMRRYRKGNFFHEREGYYEIVLSDGEHIALIDPEDYNLVRQLTWHYSDTGQNRGYVRAFLNGKNVMLHRFILFGWDARIDLLVDHRDGNPLDCRRGNLRQATRCQNLQNRRKSRKPLTSQFKGVSWIPEVKKWRARIGAAALRKSLGLYSTEEAAARAYDAAAIEAFGEFACLNFPREKEGR